MEDDHVDRRRVDVQQCTKLSLTNSPIGLIVLIDHAHQRACGASMMQSFCSHAVGSCEPALRTTRRTIGDAPCACGLRPDSARETEKDVFKKRLLPTAYWLGPSHQLLENIALSRPGGHRGVAAPVPFPNTAVKRPCANGTSSQDAGE